METLLIRLEAIGIEHEIIDAIKRSRNEEAALLLIAMFDDRHEAFYNWAMRSGYQPGLQIDRIDNDGDYCESNCQFVSREIQANNKRNVALYTINGKTLSLPQWCEMYHQDYYLVRQRVLKLGWTIQDALTRPKNPTHDVVLLGKG